MAFVDMPDCIVPPSDLRCEAMTKPTDSYQEWRRAPHRCVRRAKQGRDGHAVCSLHANVESVGYWGGEPDAFRHKRFWRWPTDLDRLAQAIINKSADAAFSEGK